MTDLREWWATASPRERDEKTAVAAGWARVTHETAGGRFWWRSPEGLRGDAVPAFTSSWEHAGGLLDRLFEEGWEFSVNTFGVKRSPSIQMSKGRGAQEANGATYPEAIALAFCLAKGATAS